MIRLRKINSLFVLSTLLFGLSLNSCATTETKASAASETVQAAVETNADVAVAPAPLPVPTETTEFAPNAQNVKLLGRSVVENDVLVMCYSSTGAEFNVSAKYLEVCIGGDNAASSRNLDGDARIVVFVNDERVVDEMVQKRSSSYVVFNSETLVEGVVRVLKVSECANSTACIQKIITDKDGKISPTAAADLKIEFIGDSITCGYGVDDLVKEHHFKTSTEDNTKTYAYKTAQKLNADYSMVSLSGWGIISGFSGDGNKVGNMALPKQYTKVGYAWNSTINGKTPQSREWDFSAFVPDVVVINLGTNDASYTKGDEKKIAEYKDGYVAFLGDVRAKNPKAYIICTLGIMGGDLYPAIETAVNEYTAATGDSKVTALRFANQNMADGIAADWHPSEKTHAKAAALLTAKITERFN